MTAARPSREMNGKGRTVRELLAGGEYSIDYYQGKYKWQQKQVAELLGDLSAKLLDSHTERAYDHNSGFLRFVEERHLPLRAHAEFRKADLDVRQVPYQRLAERIRMPERLDEEAAS